MIGSLLCGLAEDASCEVFFDFRVTGDRDVFRPVRVRPKVVFAAVLGESPSQASKCSLEVPSLHSRSVPASGYSVKDLVPRDGCEVCSDFRIRLTLTGTSPKHFVIDIRDA